MSKICALAEGVCDTVNKHCKLRGHHYIDSRNDDTASTNDHMITSTGIACVLIMSVVILGLGVVYYRHMAASKRLDGYVSVTDGHFPSLIVKKYDAEMRAESIMDMHTMD